MNLAIENKKKKITKLERLNKMLLKLFNYNGHVNINYSTNKNNTIRISYIEATIEYTDKVHITYCAAICLEEMIEKITSLYRLFRKTKISHIQTPEDLMNIISKNEIYDPSLLVIKSDLLLFFNSLANISKILKIHPNELTSERIMN
jgi:hypothetical protein